MAGRSTVAVVVIVGDHGQSLGDNGFFGHGLRLLEPVVKVPLIVRLPDQTTAARVESPVETVDLAPTLLSLAGIPVPETMQGEAFLGKQAKPPREYVYLFRDRADEHNQKIGVITKEGIKLSDTHLVPPQGGRPGPNIKSILQNSLLSMVSRTRRDSDNSAMCRTTSATSCRSQKNASMRSFRLAH